jgi:hypothetical protein
MEFQVTKNARQAANESRASHSRFIFYVRDSGVLSERIGDFNSLGEAVYFAAGQEDASDLRFERADVMSSQTRQLASPELDAFVSAMVLARTSPGVEPTQRQLNELKRAAEASLNLLCQ